MNGGSNGEKRAVYGLQTVYHSCSERVKRNGSSFAVDFVLALFCFRGVCVCVANGFSRPKTIIIFTSISSLAHLLRRFSFVQCVFHRWLFLKNTFHWNSAVFFSFFSLSESESIWRTFCGGCNQLVQSKLVTLWIAIHLRKRKELRVCMLWNEDFREWHEYGNIECESVCTLIISGWKIKAKSSSFW